MSTTRLTISNGDLTLDLTSGEGLLWFEDHDGVEVLDVERLTDRGPTQEGDTDTGWTIKPREIGYTLGLGGRTIDDLYEARRLFRQLFGVRRPAILTYTLPSGAQRQIAAYYTGRAAFARMGFTERASVQLRAGDPAFIDPIAVSIPFTVSGASGAGFSFPIAFPVQFGSSTISDVQPIFYDGDLAGYPVVYVYGPIADPIITNRTTREALDFTGTTLAGGEALEIDCRPGVKTVTRIAVGGITRSNAIGLLNDLTSSLSTFHIATDEESTDGLNEIAITASGATTATSVAVAFYRRFSGV